MLALALGWLLMGVLCLAPGYAALAAVRALDGLRLGDRLIIAFCLGLVWLNWIALTIALFTALTPLIFFSATLVVAVLAFVAGADRMMSELRLLWRRDLLLGLLITVVFCAFASSGLRPVPDTTSYHYPAIRWMEDYGAVSGVAHILIRLGFTSSIWALLAPFDLVLPGRASGVVNGLIQCVFVGQIVMVGMRVGRGQARPSDLFLGVASLGSLTLGTVIGSFTTGTPDVSVMLYTVVAAWRMLASDDEADSLLFLVPLWLSCGVLMLKLSGALLGPVAAIFAVFHAPLRRWIVGAFSAALIVSPYLAASFVMTGCFTFLVAFTCLPVPWGLSYDYVREYSHLMTLMARWSGPIPADAGPFDWIPGWLIGTRYWLNAAVFWPSILCLAAYFAIARWKFSRGELWVLALIFPTGAFVLISAPELRYNFGVFVTPIALLATRIAPRLDLKKISPLFSHPALAALALTIPMAIFSVLIDLRHSTPIGITGRLLVPRPVATTPLVEKSARNFNYVMPTDGSGCGRAPPPCADQPIASIALRRPRLGLGGGFMQCAGAQCVQ
jgi:hypothetical protein